MIKKTGQTGCEYAAGLFDEKLTKRTVPVVIKKKIEVVRIYLL